MSNIKYISLDNLRHYNETIQEYISGKVSKEVGKGLSTNDFTNELKNKLSTFDSTKFVNKEEFDNLRIDNIKDSPIFTDNVGQLNIVDENNNIGLTLSNEGLYVKDVIANNHVLSEKANLTDIPSLDGYATEDWVNSEITKAATSGKVDLTGYATETFVTEKIAEIDIPSLDGYAKVEDIPSLDGYAKTTDIPSLDGYAKTTDIPSLAGYAKTEDIPSLDGYAKTTDIPSLNNYATKQDLNNIEYSTIINTPLLEDVTGELNIIDETGNIGAKITSEGIYAKDFICSDVSFSYLLNYISQLETRILQLEQKVQ